MRRGDSRDRHRAGTGGTGALGLNTIRREGKEENDEFYALADKLGIMVMPGWECCSYWQSYGSWQDADHTVAKASATTEGLRLRNHPSVLGFYIGSDTAPPAAVEKDYLDGLKVSDWQAPIISSAAKASSSAWMGSSSTIARLQRCSNVPSSSST